MTAASLAGSLRRPRRTPPPLPRRCTARSPCRRSAPRSGSPGLPGRVPSVRASRVEVQVDGESRDRRDHRVSGLVDTEALVERAPLPVPRIGDDSVQESHPRPGGRDEGSPGPRGHHLVVGVAGDPVGTEGDHRVGAHLVDQAAELLDGLPGVDVRTSAVGVPEPVVLGDAEDREAVRQLACPPGGQAVGRPGLGSGVPRSPRVAVTHTTRLSRRPARGPSGPR